MISKARPGLILGVIVSVIAAIIVMTLTMHTHARPVSSRIPSSPAIAPGNGIVIGTAPNAQPGQRLEVTSTGYEPLTDVDVTLDGAAWNQTVSADRLGQVHFTFRVPLDLLNGRYVLEILGDPPTAARPVATGPVSAIADSPLIGATIPKVTLFQFTVR